MKFESDREEINYIKCQRDAERYRKLIRLTGSPRDGSHTRVLLYWDDATNCGIVKVGDSTSFGDFDLVIDSIPEF